MKNLVLSLLYIGMFAGSSFSQTDSASYFFNKGVEEKNARRFQVAYQQFQKAIQYKPENVEYQKEAGFAAVELRRYDQARVHFEKAYQLKSGDDAVLTQLAQLSFSLRRWPQAIQYAEQMKQKNLKGHNYILVELAEQRLHLKIIQRIVHPAHHPFHAEAKPAMKGRP